jgi:hypothetical protein
MNVESHGLYTRAYKLQHSKAAPGNSDLSNVHAAIRLYQEIISRFPDSDEAEYARSQLATLQRSESAPAARRSSAIAVAASPHTGSTASTSDSISRSAPLGIDAPTLYKLAYAAHYKHKELDRAVALYTDIVTRFAKTPEAGYARSQLESLGVSGGASAAPVAAAVASSASSASASASASFSNQSIFSATLNSSLEASKEEQRRLDDLRSMVTTASTVMQPHTIIRPIRVIAPVVDKDPNTTKSRLRAFDTAVIWLAQRAVECGGNLVIAATFDEVAPETRDDESGGRTKRSLIEIVATGTCVRLIDNSGTISAGLRSAAAPNDSKKV